jgi:hypothetical protein
VLNGMFVRQDMTKTQLVSPQPIANSSAPRTPTQNLHGYQTRGILGQKYIFKLLVSLFLFALENHLLVISGLVNALEYIVLGLVRGPFPGDAIKDVR